MRLSILKFILAGIVTAFLPSLLLAKPKVATTSTMVTDMVSDVAGDRAEIIPLMGPGVDPHLYKPAARDVSKLSQADLILYNGLMLEGRMADVFAKMSRRGAKVYAITENVPEDMLLEPPEFEGHWDPHVWFDPVIWALCVDTVVEALSDIDPEGKAYYTERGSKLKDKYIVTGEWARERISTLPVESRVLVTSHDAYNYFGRAFDFKVVGVQGISTTTEAGMADISSTIDFISDNNVKAIFVETSVSPATIQRISKDSGAKIGGELYSDALGTPGEMEKGPDGTSYDVGTWEGMIKHNVNTIVESLK